MSTRGHSSKSDPDKNDIKRSSQRKSNYSGEIDVFGTSRYFSSYGSLAADDDDDNSYMHNVVIARQERGRISLDLPIRTSSYQIQPQKHDAIRTDNSKNIIGNVKHKQPNSPGGRIASFLNSLFHHRGSTKGRSKSKSKSTEEQEDQSPGGWRRRRRSSISHFLLSSSRSNATAATTNSCSSGFRSPPPYVNTPTKHYKEFLNYAGHQKQKQVSSLDDQKRNKDLCWLDEKLKLIETFSGNQRVWDDGVRNSVGDDRNGKFSRKSIVKRDNHENVDDGEDSDSSSDLFELPNYDLSCVGLPVYETTNLENIKRNAPISNI